MVRLLPQLALVVLLATACAGLGGPRRASQAERQAFAAALAPLPDDPETAAERLRAFRRTFPDGPLVDDAGVRLAEIALAAGDADRAARWYAAVIDEEPRSDRADPARLALAKLEAGRGNSGRALDVLTPVRLSRLPPDERREAFRMMVDLSSDPVARLRALAGLRSEVSDAETASLDVEIDEVLAQLDEGDVERAADQLGRRVPAARLRLRAAEMALDAGDPLRAEAYLQEAERLPLESAYVERLSALRMRLRLRQAGPAPEVELPTFAEVLRRGVPDTARARGTLGVVLPLSGPLADVGEESLRGILLAAGVFDALAEPDARPDVRVLVRDTGGDPSRAAAAVQELAREDVVAIVGPLLSEVSESAAAAAEQARVPLVSLTAREDVARGRSWTLRVRTQAKEEVDVLVEYSMDVLEAQRFAILYPRDAYGRALRAFFWDAVEARGGKLVGIASYDPEATDFADPIRQLVGYVLLTSEEQAAIRARERRIETARRLTPEEAARLREEARAMTGPDGRPLPPIVDFDALFIPDSHERIVLIAPQLAFHRAEGMTLLGPEGWNHPDVVRLGRQHVEGAVFTATFYPDSDFPPVESFRRRYQATFEHEPDALAAQAYDAANLVLAQLARGYQTRTAVRDAMLASDAVAGATGVLVMRADGNARRRPFLLTIQQGRRIPLDLR